MTMGTSRQDTSKTIIERGANQSYTPPPLQDISNIYGTHVFHEGVMKERLPKAIFKLLMNTIDNHEPLDPSLADIVASAMKDWAIELGATHFTHWFHPLTGSTAEKHDSFIVPESAGHVLMRFSGGELSQGEPDASSFPSGGIRATFEARGYTAWDPTSPAFVRITEQGGTLCIPTAFCAYTGEALDKKTPVLRSEKLLSNKVTRLLHLLGETDVTNVKSSAGLEQEYFLIDREYYHQRPDLVACGRTLFGAASYRGQSLDDHYFGSIKARVLSFMQDTEQALYKLGIPVKTRHNEVAPAQYEMAPIYEKANLAIDQNMLIMEVMQGIAEKHKLKMLIHEKPFAGLNGSGKHCNWSMSDSNGNNLLEPGKTPHQNMQFLVVLTAIIRGLDKYAKLMRLAVATAGNDHRLGANEAPPAIISAFLGSELGHIVDMLASGGDTSSTGERTVHLGTDVLPMLPKDTTDRNRTSPFAFTGNKFEFRALGSSLHPAGPVFFLNTIVADSIEYMCDEIEAAMKGGATLDDACDTTVRATLKKHHRVVFNGDGYAEDWQQEAAKRGLLNMKTTPEATETMMDDDVVALFEKHQILTKGELESRYNIKLETYILNLEIEFDASRDIAQTIILPAAQKYQSQLASSVAATKAAGVSIASQEKQLADLSGKIEALINNIAAFEAILDKIPHGESAHAKYFCDIAIPSMNAIREVADSLEVVVDDKLWPMPKYREMLFLH